MSIINNCKLVITSQERDTILAALRYYQTIHMARATRPSDDEHNEMIENIATNCGLYPALSLDEIDEFIDVHF